MRRNNTHGQAEAKTCLLRLTLTTILVVSLVFAMSCSGGNVEEPTRKMGELTPVGPVIYNVLETEWLNELGSSVSQSTPNDKFLVVRLSITNSGNQEVAVPLLSVEDVDGNSVMELSEVKGAGNWLGLLRIVAPAQTLQGVIVFDVPAKDYNLRVTDGGDLESEKTALIELPLTLGGPGSIEPPAQPETSF